METLSPPGHTCISPAVTTSTSGRWTVAPCFSPLLAVSQAPELTRHTGGLVILVDMLIQLNRVCYTGSSCDTSPRPLFPSACAHVSSLGPRAGGMMEAGKGRVSPRLG
jgi:hypothetical protein